MIVVEEECGMIGSITRIRHGMAQRRAKKGREGNSVGKEGKRGGGEEGTEIMVGEGIGKAVCEGKGEEKTETGETKRKPWRKKEDRERRKVREVKEELMDDEKRWETMEKS